MEELANQIQKCLDELSALRQWKEQKEQAEAEIEAEAERERLEFEAYMSRRRAEEEQDAKRGEIIKSMMR